MPRFEFGQSKYEEIDLLRGKFNLYIWKGSYSFLSPSGFLQEEGKGGSKLRLDCTVPGKWGEWKPIKSRSTVSRRLHLGRYRQHYIQPDQGSSILSPHRCSHSKRNLGRLCHPQYSLWYFSDLDSNLTQTSTLNSPRHYALQLPRFRWLDCSFEWPLCVVAILYHI